MSGAPDTQNASAIDLDFIHGDIGHVFQLVDMAHDVYLETDRGRPLTEQAADADRLSALLWIACDRLKAAHGRLGGFVDAMTKAGGVRGDALSDQAEAEVRAIEEIVRRLEVHRLAWNGFIDKDGDLDTNHPEYEAMRNARDEFAAFPVCSAEGMRSKAAQMLSNDTFDHTDENFRIMFLRSIAGFAGDETGSAA